MYRQRWRWAWDQVVENAPSRLNQVRWQQANFYEQQFGVQTMNQYGWWLGGPQRDEGDDDESGTYELGGMKFHESQDLRSGVPILNKIPLVSFFFDRKGTFISNRKLLILLKANIVIPEELEPSPAQLGLDSQLAPAPL